MRDAITVHKFLSAWGQPDLSPFVFKLETYLRMAGIPYRGVSGDARRAPKGKLPYIEHDGKKIGDSSFIIEHLKTSFGDPLDAALSAHDRAVAAACQAMVEEQLYFVLLYQRWQEKPGWVTYEPVLRDYLGTLGIPAILRGAVLSMARKKVLQTLRAQGVGRHSSAEVDAIGKRVVHSVADLMGDRPFFLGDGPCSIDATVYSFMTTLMDTPFPSEVKEHARAVPALRAYTDRMRDRYWSSR